MEPILSISNLNKNYGPIKAVQNLSLTVQKGQVFGLFGPNGSGKTTILGVILGVIQPDSGTYQWFNQSNTAAARQKIGSLVSQPNFYPWLSAIRNLKIVATIRGVPFNTIDQALQLTGLWKRRHDHYGSYSLGMKQRLGIAATLCGTPDVLVLDEPANGVDVSGIADIRNIIIELAKQGKTIIIVSHILDEIEKVCSHVGILKDGQLIESGPISNVLQFKDEIEVAAENMTELGNVFTLTKGIVSFEKKSDYFCLSVEKNFSTQQLNELLFSKQIIATHLVRRRSSLETHFLELLERSKNETSSHI